MTSDPLVSAVTLTGFPTVATTIGSTPELVSGGDAVPTINNKNEMALVAAVNTSSGQPRNGIFFVSSAGRLEPVALPDERLPDGHKIVEACCTAINNAGTVAFLARRDGDAVDAWSAYVWEMGNITPVAVVGEAAPGGGKIGTVWAVCVNDRNRNALVEASVDTPDGLVGLFLFSGGKLTRVAFPGQAMPGGGTLAIEHGASFPNELGQHAFLTTLDNGSTAAYLMDADGTLSLILKSGMTTPMGQITNVGQGNGLSFGIALNTRGEVALPVTINNGLDTVVLLTPTTP